ncbi:hypothetical protein B0J17DRAFT_261554 [Rhizoctonia solani]|nr:hypothetical protein B0J17DRAFT_261554 [Rhizoctonia solani]
MTRPYITLSAYAGTPASADASATSQVTPNSPCGTYSVAMLSAEEADTPRSAGLRAIAQLRNRLDTIDEHTRELCNTRHILLRREQLLVQERDELAESLNCIEAALVTRLPSYASSVSQPSTIHDTIGNLNEDKEDSELPYKRQAISDSCDRPTVRKRPSGSNGQAASNQGISKLAPLTALGTEPTLVAECPPELMYLLQPSKSLPRPPSSSPPGSHTKTPVPSPRSRSVTRGGIRFPPGSAPRLSRDRSSSPLTQMLPPPFLLALLALLLGKGTTPLFEA